MRAVIAMMTILTVTASAARANDILELGKPFGKSYRAKFAECDAHNTFGGVPTTPHHGCMSDPSHFDHLNRVSADGNAAAAIIFESKLAWDDDGSAQACSSAHGATSQCPTTLMLHATANHPCLVGHNAAKCVPVDADTVSYVVIPGRSEKILGVGMGDYGMVLLDGREVPVIVADSGPINKIGEGSTKLLIDLSNDGSPHTHSRGVVFVLFPGSHDKFSELSPDTLPGIVRDRASNMFAVFRTANP